MRDICVGWSALTLFGLFISWYCPLNYMSTIPKVLHGLYHNLLIFIYVINFSLVGWRNEHPNVYCCTKAKNFELDTRIHSFEEATWELAHLQILYECTLLAFPTTQEIWVKYIKYIDVILKVFLSLCATSSN